MPEGDRTSRGVYEVDPPGPSGEILMIVVGSSGRRCRPPIEVMPDERELAIEQLWRYLDATDPVADSRREFQLIKVG